MLNAFRVDESVPHYEYTQLDFIDALVQVDENTKFMVSPDCRKQMVKN
jgi:hypothetical protein